ncbi:MAG: hypothetical protein AAFR00_04375 [Pseudomonadota bacterium]
MFAHPALRAAFETVPVHRWPVLVWQIFMVGLWLQQLQREGKLFPALWVDVSGMIYEMPPPTYFLRESTALPACVTGTMAPRALCGLAAWCAVPGLIPEHSPIPGAQRLGVHGAERFAPSALATKTADGNRQRRHPPYGQLAPP